MRPLQRFIHIQILITTMLACTAAPAADSVVIFMYHHVDRDTPASTSVSPARFAEHMAWLEANEFSVLPLAETLESLRRGDELPDHSVVITFDDGYLSVLSEAAPELERRGWPFTVFVSTEYIDSAYSAYLSWDQLRTLTRMGATIGNHSRSHAHLVRRLEEESTSQWRARIANEIASAAQRIEAEVGDSGIPVLAYPYGEYDAATKSIVASLGLFGLGQHSGAIGSDADWYALPRFPVATGFDSLEEFSLRAQSKPLVVELLGEEKHVSEDKEPALEGFLRDTEVRRDEFACYASGQGRMQVEWLDADTGRFIARPNAPLQPGRTKYNCTAPSATHNGVFHWFSYLWMTRRADGTWYD